MAADYDAPRVNRDEPSEPFLDALNAKRTESGADLGDDADPFEAESDLAGADLAEEELAVRIVPQQRDEFTCSRCFLVHHRSQLVDVVHLVCRDCAE